MVEGESNSLAETAKLECLTQKSSLQDVDLLQQTQRLANDPSKASSLQSSFASNGVLDAVGLGAGAETALARTERAEPLQLSVTRPLNDPNWSERIFERINWMANAKQQHAEIRLDPPDLGPLKIEVQIRGEQTSVIMGSHSPQVRELLEQQIPKLREMLAESGFTQLDAQTQDQSQQRQAEHVSTQSRVLQFDESEQERQDEPIAQPIIQKHGKGSVDCYI